MRVDGTPYTLAELDSGWWVLDAADGAQVAGPYRSREIALSVAITTVAPEHSKRVA